jgi:predicted RNA methylase
VGGCPWWRVPGGDHQSVPRGWANTRRTVRPQTPIPRNTPQIDSDYGELEGQCVVDLGCGTGMLSIGAALLGASHVVGLDIDAEALETAVENVCEFGDEDEDGEGEGLPIDFILSDIPGLLGQEGEGPSPLLSRLRADVVLMNPPFGTKKHKGVDMEFLRAAFQVLGGHAMRCVRAVQGVCVCVRVQGVCSRGRPPSVGVRRRCREAQQPQG